MTKPKDLSIANLWPHMQRAAESQMGLEPTCAPLLRACVDAHKNFVGALVFVLAEKLASAVMPESELRDLFLACCRTNPDIERAAQRDLIVTLERDPAACSVLTPFLFFKGYHALQTYRIAHALWMAGRRLPALLLQSRASESFAVDIHPAARIGQGIMLDHATGIVIGETAVVGDNVSLLHGVTLGGTGNEQGDRHPKIGDGVLIGAGAKVLGNITIGSCARIAAGSVVLEPVPPCVTVAGVPARIVGKAGCDKPAESMDQLLAADCISI